MNPEKHRSQIQAAVEDLLRKASRADYGTFTLELKVHAGQLRQIDITGVNSIRLDDGQKPRG